MTHEEQTVVREILQRMADPAFWEDLELWLDEEPAGPSTGRRPASPEPPVMWN